MSLDSWLSTGRLRSPPKKFVEVDLVSSPEGQEAAVIDASPHVSNRQLSSADEERVDVDATEEESPASANLASDQDTCTYVLLSTCDVGFVLQHGYSFSTC